MATAVTASRPILRMGSATSRISSTNRGIRVRNCEQIDTIISADAVYTYTRINIGGHFTAFPWLTDLAIRYNYFRVHRMRVFLLSNCPSTQRGDVAIGWCPDTLDASAWASTGHPAYIYNFPVAISGPAWAGNGREMMIDVGPSDLYQHSTNPWKRVGGATTTDGHNQIYAGSILWQSGSNQSGNFQGVGQLVIEYDIEFAESANPSINSFSLSLSDPMSERESRQAPDTQYPRSLPLPLSELESNEVPNIM